MSRRNRQNSQNNVATTEDTAVMENTELQENNVAELPREDVEPVAELSQEDPVADVVVPVLDEEVDMGEVEIEKELSPLAKTILGAGKQSVERAKNIVKATSSPKTPIFGKRPKGSFPYGTMVIKDRSIKFAPHHQKELILELVELLSKGKEGATMQKIVEMIESQESLWTRLKSKQAVYDCVNFHTKHLFELGVLGPRTEIIEETEADETKEILGENVDEIVGERAAM